ncbi:phosphate ABC transporter substrate-binding protein [Rhizobium sp. R72]|uniref:phosphate/phosphite/phosphonate ABC transporter substrate-binding protein n=1 Tax=unclassified Rhizobium TaxID=2613769 RepID=UPI000B53048A|nr:MULTISPECIES: PhnD/SsuA/transferrin family substrate-binding protein [unclassified Rhizobium]OWW04728.1 phosphate ABC transporter substrate-binding protein [Rhizobium sp. R72]OWW05785.1 phosphate ABC transporter substrate-binding protein [Rhizobium sp. R711]
MRLASLSMYVDPQPLMDATAELWRYISNYLRHEAGLSGVPAELDRSLPYDEAWLHPDLILAQSCGYPYAKRLRGSVRLVATPTYNLPGCDGPLMRSFIVVHNGASARSLADLRDLTAAVNNHESNSGSNFFRAEIAPRAQGGRFFSKVIETGGHAASITAVAEGSADVAAIDCVTFGNIRRFEPERLSNLRILAETTSGPGLPFVTSSGSSDEEVEQLQNALQAAISDPSLALVRDRLALSGFATLADADYEPLLALERQAAALGYARIG